MIQICNGLIKKFVKAIICLIIVGGMMITCMMPISASADSDTVLPNTAFITLEELVELSENVNSGNGLLCTGSDTDVKIRLNFGSRSESLKYAYDSETEKTANAGPITWLVAGSDADADTNENSEGSIVLYSEEPLGVGVFSVSQNELNCGSDMAYANHWGTSALRDYAESLYTNTNYFSAEEKASMSPSQIKTYDYRNSKECTTEDILYAPSKHPSGRRGQIAVGAEDSILIDSAYWSGMHWLRSANEYDNESMIAVPKSSSVSYSMVTDSSKARSFAFRLELAHVLFASSANSATVSDGGLVQVSADTPMTLRIDSDSSPLFLSSLDVQNGIVRYRNAPTNARIMALFTTSDGTMYQYSKPVSGDGQLSVANIVGSRGGNRFVGKAWLECDMPDGGTLTYATAPQNIDYYACGTPVTRGDGVVQYVDEVGNTSVELASGNLDGYGMLWIEESAYGIKTLLGIDLSQSAFASDQGAIACARIITEGDSDHAEIYARLDAATKERVEDNKEILFRFAVIDKSGNTLQPTSPVRIYLQIDEDWDTAEIKALCISDGNDEALPTEYVEKVSAGVTNRFAVLTLNNISEYYFLFCEESDAEKLPNSDSDNEGGDSDGSGNVGDGDDESADTSSSNIDNGVDETDEVNAATDPIIEDNSNGNKPLTTILVIASIAAVIGIGTWLWLKKKR